LLSGKLKIVSNKSKRDGINHILKKLEKAKGKLNTATKEDNEELEEEMDPNF
jgi:hypothetical protein